MRFLASLLCAVVFVWLSIEHRALAVPMQVEYFDQSGEGFDDPTLGPQRRAAFEYAVSYWSNTLRGTVPIVVRAAMDSDGGSGDFALLGSTRALTLHRNFPGAPRADVLYNAALASQLAGSDVNGADTAEIETVFNVDVDNDTVLGSVGWYYGVDGLPGSDIDFVTIALHELGHGLGFSDQVDVNGYFAFGLPTAFDLNVSWVPFGSFSSLLAAERRVATRSGDLSWNGPHVVAARGAMAPLYAPPQFSDGSSVSHWDTSLAELMAPFYLAPNHNPGLLLPALVDIGWELAEATPITSVVPTQTATPPPTPSASPTVGSHIVRAYVSNFDSGSVSVVDLSVQRTVATIEVGGGPIGVAASANGRYLYAANFRSAEVDVIATSSNSLVARITTGGSPNRIALTPDGELGFVTLTDSDRVAVIDLATQTLASLIDVAPQPEGIAISADGGRVFVTHFGAPVITMIDAEAGIVRAELIADPRGADGLLDIALSPTSSTGFVIANHSRNLQVVDLAALTATYLPLPTDSPQVPTSIVVSPDGQTAYFASHSVNGDSGRVTPFGTAYGTAAASFTVGNIPMALALADDGRKLLSADSGSDSVSLVDLTRKPPSRTRIGVGDAPMGVAVAAVPPACPGDCDGDGRVTSAELALAMRLAVRDASSTACAATDSSGDGRIAVEELVVAISNATRGCPE